MSIFKIMKSAAKTLASYGGIQIARNSRIAARELLGLRRRNINTIIDVGANEGQFAKDISRVFPSAVIYCFEPLPLTYEKLRSWAEDGHPQIRTFNLALGEEEGKVEMYQHVEHSPSSSILIATDECVELFPKVRRRQRITVNATTLDKMFGDKSDLLNPEILIKLDVQGFEGRVLRGGTQTLRKSAACIVEASLFKLYKDQTGFEDIVWFLRDWGFHYAGNLSQVYRKQGDVLFVDSVFVKDTAREHEYSDDRKI